MRYGGERKKRNKVILIRKIRLLNYLRSSLNHTVPPVKPVATYLQVRNENQLESETDRLSYSHPGFVLGNNHPVGMGQREPEWADCPQYQGRLTQGQLELSQP
jgi:hypothetical protein